MLLFEKDFHNQVFVHPITHDQNMDFLRIELIQVFQASLI
jgi:hypothetical protein